MGMDGWINGGGGLRGVQGDGWRDVYEDGWMGIYGHGWMEERRERGASL